MVGRIFRKGFCVPQHPLAPVLMMTSCFNFNRLHAADFYLDLGRVAMCQ
jgi:hypothetical protein